jgi:tetratricopeptide (TPR) repeat protein
VAIGLDDALLGWLVESAGSRLVDTLRGDPARAAMRNVVEEAVDHTVEEFVDCIAPDAVEHLRASLLVHSVGFDSDRVRVTSETELRDALHAWTTALDRPGFGEHGYLSQLRVNPQRLAQTLADRIVAGIKLDGRSGGALRSLAEWMWRDDTTLRLARIEERIEAAAEPRGPLRGGLPGGTPDFTGRRQVLADLAARVRTHDPAGTIVAIHSIDGMAGIGKTELAIRAAHDHKHRYPDGQYFINLHGYTAGIPPVSPEVALEELLRQAGVPGGAIPSDLAGRQTRWQSLMATRRALVLLDNALDADQVRALLPCSAGCLVLITSRTRLRGLPGVRALQLDVLPLTEAVELFTCLVDGNRQLDLDAVARVVDMVGRLPVAVQAVAGQVDDGYTEAELADDLAHAKAGLGLVDAAGPLGTGVRAALETSIGRLDLAHQRRFWVLGVHPGPSIGLPQFAALAGLPTASARTILRGLADRNLIMASPGRVGHRRFQLHDLIRAFAREQAASHLSKEEQAAAITRLASWYANAMTDIAGLLARLRSTTGDPEGTEAEVKVEGLDVDRLDTASQWIAAEQSNLLAFAEVATGAPAAEVCSQAARNLFYLDYYASAQALFHAAVGFYRQAGDRAGESAAFRGLGELARLTGDYPAATGHYRAAQTTCAEIGALCGDAEARLGLGDVARLTGDYPAAADYFHAAWTAFVGMGARGGEAEARLGLGDVARLTGDYSAANDYFHAAWMTFIAIGARAGVAEARWGLGDVARLTGDYPAAAEHFHAAWTTFIAIGDRAGEADACRALGDVALATGDYPAAADHYRAAQTTYAEIRNRAGEAGARRGLGDVALATGDYPAATDHYRAAQTTYAETGDPALEAEELVAPREIATAQAERDGARELWKRAHRMYDDR